MTAPLVALVPLKPADTAKSRLSGVPDAVRRRLAAAFAKDVVAALSADADCAAVVVVSADPGTAPQADLWVPDTGDLNGSLIAAAAAAREQWPDAVPVAVCGDLPCLVPGDLGLFAGLVGACFVPDLAGTGTTAYAAPYDAFAPRFGSDSRAAHRAAGAHELTAPARWRNDVDTLADLERAVGLGLGEATLAVLTLEP